MNVQLKYDETAGIKAGSVAVVGSFNGYDESRGKMTLRDKTWHTELNLPPGEYYYKFLINREILLNDPLANAVLFHGETELWSPLFINEEGRRLYNNETYSLHIDDYACGPEMPLETKSKRFCLRQDKRMTVRFGFTAVTGLHAVTVLWHNPLGQLHTMTESALAADESRPEKPVYRWFKNPLDGPWRDYPLGTWTMKLFINGRSVLEDAFLLTDEIRHISETV